VRQSTDSQQVPTIPLATQNQSRLLLSWLPLHHCTVGGCDQSGAFDRRDGRCYYHGKVADGLFGARRDGRPTYNLYPWAEWFDGNAHVVRTTAKFDSFRRTAQHMARKRGVTVTVWTTEVGIYLRAIGLAA